MPVRQWVLSLPITPGPYRSFDGWRATAIAMVVLVSTALCGCAATYTTDVPVHAPVLPEQVDPRLSRGIGVLFDDAFRLARPETSENVGGATLVWRYAFGTAGVSVFRQALQGMFGSVVEVDHPPTTARPAHGVDLVLVPSAPVLYRQSTTGSALWLLTPTSD